MNSQVMPAKIVTGYKYLKRGQLHEFFRFTWHYIYAITHFSTKGNRLLETPTPSLNVEGLKIAVYTCIVGHYDSLIEPAFIEPGIDYYVFTDMVCPENTCWKKIDITQFEEYEELTPTQLNRKIKMLPFVYLPDYDYTLYVDGNIKIMDAITPMIKEMGNHALGVHYHRTRDCIYHEIVNIAYLKKADMDLVRQQIAAYKKQGFPRHNGLYENTILIRKHADKDMCLLMEAWWQEYVKYPTRDQLSLPYIIWQLGYDKKKIHIMGMNLYHNPRFKKISSHS